MLLFQEFTFEVVIKPGRLNVGPDHLSRLESRENEGSLDDQLTNVDLFRIEAIPDYLEEISLLLAAGHSLEGYTTTQERHLIVRAEDYQLIVGHLYKLGLDQVLQCCLLQHKR